MGKKEGDGGCRDEGVTRRGFLGSVGAGVVAAGVASSVAEGGVQITDPEAMIEVVLKVNGRAHRVLVEPRWSLLFVLRDRIGLTGSKPGCERGECGSCTVLVDGRPQYACLTLAVEAEGREIETVEGLMRGEELGDVQQAFVAEDAFQCGYCTPGQVVAAEGLLRANLQPTGEEIRHGMSGNLCRCAAYTHIVKAVERAGRGRNGGGS
jgi:xanthine dehydrogenase YagT iron-sulfur-binding subunit